MDPDAYAYPNHSLPEASEVHHERLAAYSFARRHARGKNVAVVGGDDTVYGARVLAETAGSVAGFVVSQVAALVASTHPAPNTTYEPVDLPKLPRPDDSLDVVVAPGVVQSSDDIEALLEEARRVLKEDGVLVLSVPNKASGAPHVRHGMYAPELEALLGRYFQDVRLYTLGAVSGGAVFPADGEKTGAIPEGAHFALSDPAPGAGWPGGRSLLAVCSSGGGLGDEETYFLLDRDRRVFEDREDLREDVEMLRGEVLRMRESEAQAFQDTLRLRNSEVNHFKNRLDLSDAHLRELMDRNEKLVARNKALEGHLQEIQGSRAWRLLGLYRRLRTGKR